MAEKTTTIEVREKGEWGTFFVREFEITPRENGRVNASAEWVCRSSFGVFGHYWNSMGEPFADFIQGVGDDYLLSKIGREVTDSDKVLNEVNRLIHEARKQKRITKDIEQRAIHQVKLISEEADGATLCHLLYIDPVVNLCPIEWCDISTQSYDGASRMFVKKLWPAFVKQFREQAKELVTT